MPLSHIQHSLTNSLGIVRGMCQGVSETSVDGKTVSSRRGLLHTPLRDLGMQGKKGLDRCI